MGGKKRQRSRHLAIKNWQLILILIPLLFVAATLLRLDHIKMTELRTAVITADATGNEEELESSLRALQDFTFSHIIINITEENGLGKVSFGTGAFYLEGQYHRAAEAALAAAEANFVEGSNPNGNVYAKASSVCSNLAKKNGWKNGSAEFINCVMDELAKFPASDSLVTTATVALPSTELYRVSYSSPLWAPTPAGFVILLAALLLAVIIVRIIIWLILELSLLIVSKFSRS